MIEGMNSSSRNHMVKSLKLRKETDKQQNNKNDKETNLDGKRVTMTTISNELSCCNNSR